MRARAQDNERYQAWASPQCGQVTDAETAAWKAEPQRQM
jgi:hypothetical protein